MPGRKSIVALTYELMAADARKAKKVKPAEVVEPRPVKVAVKKTARKGKK